MMGTVPHLESATLTFALDALGLDASERARAHPSVAAAVWAASLLRYPLTAQRNAWVPLDSPADPILAAWAWLMLGDASLARSAMTGALRSERSEQLRPGTLSPLVEENPWAARAHNTALARNAGVHRDLLLASIQLVRAVAYPVSARSEAPDSGVRTRASYSLPTPSPTQSSLLDVPDRLGVRLALDLPEARTQQARTTGVLGSVFVPAPRHQDGSWGAWSELPEPPPA